MKHPERHPSTPEQIPLSSPSGRNRISRREVLGNFVDLTAASALMAFSTWYRFATREKEIRETGIESYLNSYEPLDPFPIQGANLRVIGVAHTRETFVANMEDMRQRVRRGPFILLEYFFDELQQRARPGISMDQKMGDRFDNRTEVEFFSGVGRICAEEGKDIVVVNPQTNILVGIDDVLHYSIPIYVSGASFLDLTMNLLGKPTTRRSFLRHMGLGASALVSASWLGITRNLRSALEKDGILSSDMPENEQANILSWSILDYRDIRSAEGIEKAFGSLSNELSPHDEIPMFEGYVHNGKLEYLKYPELREMKKHVYLHYDLVDTNIVRRYTYNPDDNVWLLKQEIPY